MRAEIISIGTELLLGQIVDTNAVYLSQQLAELGISLFYRATVGDNPQRLDEVLQIARERSQLIICTGGLGPTEDDITSEGISRACAAPLQLDEKAAQELEAWFTRRGRTMTENQRKQAMIPAGAQIIPNPVGTAPGFIVQYEGVTFMAFPGPPEEMHTMWQATAWPYLRALSPEIIYSRTLRFCGIGEGPLEMLLKPVISVQNKVTVAPYAKTIEAHIRLTTKAESEEAALALIAPVEAEIRQLAGSYLYGIDEQSLEEVIGLLLRERKETLSVAESCTGGSLGARMTNIPGCSDYFLGGVISYANELKSALLKVPDNILEQDGAVSGSCAVAMAEGVRTATGADWALSITGIAGPGGGSEEKPVGTVYIGLANSGKATQVKHLLLGGERETVRRRAVQEALVLLREYLLAAEVEE